MGKEVSERSIETYCCIATLYRFRWRRHADLSYNRSRPAKERSAALPKKTHLADPIGITSRRDWQLWPCFKVTVSRNDSHSTACLCNVSNIPLAMKRLLLIIYRVTDRAKDSVVPQRRYCKHYSRDSLIFN